MMLERCNRTVPSLLLGCLALLLMTSVVNADGRVFVLALRNSSGLQGFRDAEQACASQQARLASAEELRHAVVECFFSSCTRGWLRGGTVGTTVCNTVGSALKAVDVRTENATEDTSHLEAFCIKDNGVPCGDPPSFPNARLQGHTGFEMGDELLYTCVPGYLMPNGQSAFSLLCDSCGEWYGLVQMCIRDGSEVHVDYEDRFTDSNEDKPEGTRHHLYEEVDGTTHWKGKMSQEQQETGFGEMEHREQEVRGEVVDFEESIERKEKDEEWAVQDFTGHPTWERDSREVVRTDAPGATEAPVSLLSQKHMFWFPSEAFQEDRLPVSTNPATQSTQRSSGGQSEESIEQEGQKMHEPPTERDGDDHDDDHNVEDQDDPNDSHQDQDDHDSRQDEDDHHDHDKHYIPVQPDDHEDDRIPHNNHEYDDQDETEGTPESHEDHGDDHRADDDDDHNLHASEERPDHDDHDDDPNGDNDRYTDHDDHEHDDHDSYDDLDSHEYDDDGHQRVIFSIAPNQRRNITQKKTGGKTTTDETWLDGYPVVPEEREKHDSETERGKQEHRQRGTAFRSTDRPNEVEIRRPAPFPNFPEKPRSPTVEPEPEQGVEIGWGGYVPTGAPSPDHLQPSDSHSDPDTQQAAPTDSWLGNLTQHPFLDHDPAPPVHDNDILAGVMEEHAMHNLPGEAGERGEMEGERGEATCTGENCPPRAFGRGPKVAAIIVAVLAVAVAAVVGVWCYRRQQQKSSVYEMNGKGKNPSGAGQQMEMQQKV